MVERFINAIFLPGISMGVGILIGKFLPDSVSASLFVAAVTLTTMGVMSIAWPKT